MKPILTILKPSLFKGLFLFIFSLSTFQAWSINFKTSGKLNGTGNLYNWSNQNAWLYFDKNKWVESTGQLPDLNDDVFIEHDITIPQNVDYSCKSLTVEATTNGVVLFFARFGKLTVYGNVEIKGPQVGTNLIEIPQGQLFIYGNLKIGTVPYTNGWAGNAKISVRGATDKSAYGLLKVAGNISNGNNTLHPQSAPAASILEVTSTGELELGGAITLSNVPNGAPGVSLTPSFAINSTIRFNGTVSQQIPVIDFVNVSIANPAGVTLSRNLTGSALSGNLIIESGKLTNNGYTIAGQSGKIIEIRNNAQLVLANGSYFPSGFGGVDIYPYSTVTYSGTIYQEVAGLNYGNLEFFGGLNSQKKVMGAITAGNTTVDADLLLTNGGIAVNDNTLTLKNTGRILNSSSTNARYIKLGENGKMKAERIGPTAVFFPIGTNTTYNPVTISNNNPAGTNDFSVKVIDGVRLNYNSGTYLKYHIVDKTWDITPSGTGADATITLQWNASDENSNFNRNRCFVNHYNTSSQAWEQTSDISQSALQVSVNVYSATMSGIKAFSPFGVTDGGNPLPVELVFFKAAKQDNGVALTWETASEKNNKGYDVQVSTDGKHFEFVSFVASKNGNANYSQRYEFLDKTSRSGLVYYRLKQTDFDGTVAYYAAKVVDMGKFTESVSAYPNPFRDQFEIKLQAAAAQDVLLQITDMAGKTVYRNAPKVLAGQNVIPVTFENNLPAGLYILTAKTATQVYTTRIVKQ